MKYYRWTSGGFVEVSMTEAGWTRDKEVEPAIDELKAQVQTIYNAGYQQGRVAGLDEVERYMAMRLRLAEASLATEILAGNEVKQGRERAAIAELHGMQRHVSDIKEYNAQQAQGGVGDDLFILP